MRSVLLSAHGCLRNLPGPVFHLVSSFALQALGSFYFLHESLKNIYQFDFKGKTPCCQLPGILLGFPVLVDSVPTARWAGASGPFRQCLCERTGRSGFESLAAALNQGPRMKTWLSGFPEIETAGPPPERPPAIAPGSPPLPPFCPQGSGRGFWLS